MRFFIFPIENIHIAISADKVARFVSHNSEESGDTKIPLCMFFSNQKYNENSPSHGIVLKQETDDNKTTVIITPPVEEDINVAQEEIHSLPESFCGVYSSFNGMFFNKQKIIFFLDVEIFISLWNKMYGRVSQ
ncbi:MAG: hypothetical protein FWC01_00695 [Treponema sp.]|nr:hypothetical protein [Treponema sp.]MCL2237210.1 hypothetical protein [Treponema sp.]